MEGKKGYTTRQRKAILDYLTARPEELFSAEELMLALREAGENIGLATVYRNLDKLASQDILTRILPGDGSGAKYEYLAKTAAAEGHYHMVCQECGRTLHINCGQLAQLAAHIKKDHDFILDRSRTVLYGCCSQCAEKHKQKER